MEEQAGAALGLGQLQLVQVPVTTATVEGLHATYVDAATVNKDADPVICHTLPLPEGFQVGDNFVQMYNRISPIGHVANFAFSFFASFSFRL